MGTTDDVGGTHRFSAAVPRPAWYPVCRSGDLGSKRPLASEFAGAPLVVFRGNDGRPGVLEDRCPHRNVPLSLGRVRDGQLECGYHGWRFDACGSCVTVPGLDAPADATTRTVTRHDAVDRDGFVWFWSEPDEDGIGEPFRLPDTGRGFHGPWREVVLSYDIDATMHAAIENTLDVPHTAFLHRGFLRGAEPNQIRAVRRGLPDGVEVRYHGEPFGIGFLRLGSGGTELGHWDRFVLPCVAQVEYRAGPWLTILNSVLHLPLDELRTRAWFVLRFASARLPLRLVQGIVRVQGPSVARQDVAMLARQTEGAARFGGEHYTSTDLDLFGGPVWRLLRRAEQGPIEDATDLVTPKEITFRA